MQCLDLRWDSLGLLDDKRFNRLIESFRKNVNIINVRLTPQCIESASKQHHLSPERLKMIHELLMARITLITHLAHITVRILKNITLKDCKLGKTLPLGVINKVLSFCPLHQKLTEQALAIEFPRPSLKPRQSCRLKREVYEIFFHSII